jgi:hypothetical protein
MEKRRVTDVLGEQTGPYNMCPRYEYHELTSEQIDVIAENAAKRALALGKDEMYRGVGKTVVGWIFWIVGLVAVGAFIVAVQMGWVKP